MFTVTKQSAWPSEEEDFIVEINYGDRSKARDYLILYTTIEEFPEEKVLEAVEYAISAAIAWKKQKPEMDIYLSIHSDWDFNKPYGILDEEIIQRLRDWAQEIDDKMDHCDHCSETLSPDPKKIYSVYGMGDKFCSKYCCEAYLEEENRINDVFLEEIHKINN